MQNRILAAALSFLLALVPTVASAQPFPSTLPPNTVYGRSGIGPGPGQAIPFANLASQVFSQTTAPLIAKGGIVGVQPYGGQATLQLGVPLRATTPYIDFYASALNSNYGVRLTGVDTGSIPGAGTLDLAGALAIHTPSNTATPALSIFQTGVTSGSTAGTVSNASAGNPALAYNQVFIGGDAANVTGATDPKITYGTNFAMVTGGLNSTSNKVGLNTFLYKSAASTPAIARDHIAFGAQGLIDFGDGGTGLTINTAKGTMFAAGFNSTARSGATNLFEVAAMELGTALNTGSSAVYRWGISNVSAGQVLGSVSDAAYTVAGGGGTGWGNGLLYTAANGGVPLTTTGTAITTDGSVMTVGSVLDFGTNVTVTNYFLRGPGFSVDGSGNLSSRQLTSTVATGTAPLVVASTTQVANLNAATLGGATFAAPGAIGGGTPSTGAFTTLSATGQVTSTVATGTAPLVIASTTQVANLNAATSGSATTATNATNLTTTNDTTNNITVYPTFQRDVNQTLPLWTSSTKFTFNPSTGALGATSFAGLLTSATGLPISTGLSGAGTGVLTALGVNVGTAGAFVVNGGALGSPSSAGTLPAHTLGGTVSGGGNQINNVIIGTSTPLAGFFTTLSATGHATIEGVTSTGATGTGKFVFDASPTLITPTLGVATATSVNGATFAAPQVTVLTSGTAATYTTPSGATRLEVEGIGPGGGGSGSGTTPGAGANGSAATTFAGSGISTLTGNVGTGASGIGGASGGTATNGDDNITGADGQGAAGITAQPGAAGGASVYGGAGNGGYQGAGGGTAKANTGAGGGGASSNAAASPGGGGGAGGYFTKVISSPAATYTYTIGTGGAGGTAGTSGFAGGAGAAGRIKVKAYFNFLLKRDLDPAANDNTPAFTNLVA